MAVSRKVSNGICVGKLQMGFVYESFKWSFCEKASNGACAGKLQMGFM